MYEIGPDLLDGFISLGAVELLDDSLADAPEVDDDTSNEPAESKSEGDAPENKAIHAAPENKKRKK